MKTWCTTCQKDKKVNHYRREKKELIFECGHVRKSRTMKFGRCSDCKEMAEVAIVPESNEERSNCCWANFLGETSA